MRRVSPAAAAVANDAVEVKKAASESGGGASDQGGNRTALAPRKITISGCEKARKTGKKRAIQCNFEHFPCKKRRFSPLAILSCDGFARPPQSRAGGKTGHRAFRHFGREKILSLFNIYLRRRQDRLARTAERPESRRMFHVKQNKNKLTGPNGFSPRPFIFTFRRLARNRRSSAPL
jgi:hypothetical protein